MEREKLTFLGEALSAVRELAKVGLGWHTRPPLAGSALPPRMLESTKFIPRRNRARYHGQRSPRSSFGIFDLFLGRAGRLKPGRFGDSSCRRSWPCDVRTRPLPRRGYCDARRCFRSIPNLQYIAEGTPYRCVTLLDTGSPQTFIRRNVFDRMLLVAYIPHTGWRAERSLLVRVPVWVG